MWRARVSSLILAAVCLLVLAAFAALGKAKMEVPAGLAAAAEPQTVTGSNPRAWNRPLAFGPYRTRSVREGLELSWSVEAFGVRGGQAKKPYRLVLDGPDGASWEVECLTRSIEVWRGGWSVELTDAFEPRLVCGIKPPDDGPVLRLILGSSGRDLAGVVHAVAAGEDAPPLLRLRSVHRLEGSRWPLGEPAGYVVERAAGAPATGAADAVVAAVETINRGRVWLAPELDSDTRDQAAAAIAALLLYDPELSPQGE